MLMQKDGIFREVPKSKESAFLAKGYVEASGDKEEVKTLSGTGTPFDGKTADELIAYAKEKGCDIGQSTSPKGIFEKIAAFEKKAGVN